MKMALLLADPSPCLRWLVLRDLLGRGEGGAPAAGAAAEMAELAALRATDRLVTEVTALQGADGAWQRDAGYGGDLAVNTSAGKAHGGNPFREEAHGAAHGAAQEGTCAARRWR